jgi:MATE family multidrug resistance protein
MSSANIGFELKYKVEEESEETFGQMVQIVLRQGLLTSICMSVAVFQETISFAFLG